ncbi:hypothetical protein D3C84_686840 [compost metagenome]
MAHAVADQQRQVRVIKADDRYVELPPRIQRRPCGEIGVADFDQIGLQVLQDIAPGRETQREAIALAEGQGRCRNGVNAIQLAKRRSGNQQTVANARFDAQATVLGIQISAHATAGRGVEHGYVSDMHDEHPSGPVLPWLTFMKDSCSVGSWREGGAPTVDLLCDGDPCRSELARDAACSDARYGNYLPIASSALPAVQDPNTHATSIAGFPRLPGSGY